MKFYSDEVESLMLEHYAQLSEKIQRHYLAIEAEKIGYGGITYIAELFGSSRSRIHRGIKELKQPAYFVPIPVDKQRRKGAGAPKKKIT